MTDDARIEMLFYLCPILKINLLLLCLAINEWHKYDILKIFIYLKSKLEM